MIYWKGGTLEDEVLITQAVNQWIDHNEDPCECFYDVLEDLEFESFYSDFMDALENPRSISKKNIKVAKKQRKGFG